MILKMKYGRWIILITRAETLMTVWWWFWETMRCTGRITGMETLVSMIFKNIHSQLSCSWCVSSWGCSSVSKQYSCLSTNNNSTTSNNNNTSLMSKHVVWVPGTLLQTLPSLILLDQCWQSGKVQKRIKNLIKSIFLTKWPINRGWWVYNDHIFFKLFLKPSLSVC